MTLTCTNELELNDTLATAGDGNFSEARRTYAASALASGFVLEGTVSMTFGGSYPPSGSRLDMTDKLHGSERPRGIRESLIRLLEGRFVGRSRARAGVVGV
jgi:hypothetical protein